MGNILIRHARIVDPLQKYDAVSDILVSDGVIAQIGNEINAQASIVEAEGLLACPGIIDIHVHLRDPGQTYKEDIFTGCEAAAAGGVTSLLCMPNTSPTADSPEVIRYILEKAEKAKARVYPAAAITKGLESRELCDYRALKQAGAVAVTDDGRPVETEEMMEEGMRAAGREGLFVTSHCEVLPLVAGGIINEGNVSKQLGVKGMPRESENLATAREIAIAERAGCAVHIAHVSTKEACECIREAKKRGVRVTAETAPHYFTLTEEELLKQDANYRMNPPLRTGEDREAIRRAIADGTIDVFATDHAPHSAADKADFFHAPNGIVGLETSLALAHTMLVKTGLVSIGRLIEMMSSTPARLLHIPGGTLAPGAPADLVLFDPHEEWTVRPEELHSKSKNTPFGGMALTGRVRATICRGELVYQR